MAHEQADRVGAAVLLEQRVEPLGVVGRRRLAAVVDDERRLVQREPRDGEPGRSITGREVERVLGVPVLAEVPYDPAIARAVDAGLLLARLPVTLARPLGAVLERVA